MPEPVPAGGTETGADGDLRVSLAGPVEEARFAFLREGDTETSDLQFRQHPIVCGRRPDNLAYDALNTYLNRPKLTRAYTPGYDEPTLVATWLPQLRPPVRMRPGTSGDAGQPYVRLARLVPETNRWEYVGDIVQQTEVPDTMAADAVSYPDTGELIVVMLAQDLDAGSRDRRIYVFHSIDAPISSVVTPATWRQRSRLFLEGQDQDVLLYDAGSFAGSDITNFIALAVERLPSGRLVAIVRTIAGLWSLVSDDRGHSFRAVLIDGTLAGGPTGGTQYSGADVACTIARNGALVVAYTDIDTVFPAPAEHMKVKVAISGDGESWGTPMQVSPPNFAGVPVWGDPAGPNTPGPMAVGITMRPDGFLQIYISAHHNDVSAQPREYLDWLASVSSIKRDPDLGDTAEDLWGVTRFTGFHGIEQSAPGPTGNLDEDGVNPDVLLYGFHGIDAELHRGQIHLIAQVVEESGSESAPIFEACALEVYRLSHWQPLQERLTDARTGSPLLGVPARIARGRIYNRTWDCYGIPDRWGFALTASGGTTAPASAQDGIGSPGGDEGGYIVIDTPAPGFTRGYLDTTLPSPSGGLDCAGRAVVQVTRNNHITGSDEVRVESHVDNGVTGHGIAISFDPGGGIMTINVLDAFTGASLGSKTFPDGSAWYEVIWAIYEVSGSDWRAQVFARAYDRTNDPDWDGPYTAIIDHVATTPDASITDRLAFGHLVSASDSNSRWKTVQIARTPNAFSSELNWLYAVGDRPLEQHPNTFLDVENLYAQPLSGDGHHRIDDGLDNHMRTGLTTAIPEQWLERGLRVAWRGRAETEGGYLYETGYDYGARNVERTPVVDAEWRSVEGDTASSIELIWDAGNDNRRFRPNAVALFGRNFHSFTFELWDSDPLLGGSADVSIRVGMPVQSVVVDRYAHLWATDRTDGWIYYCEGNRLTVYQGLGTETASPWRPHEFCSARGGAKFYLYVERNSGLPYIYRILDNTEDTLIFGVDLANEIGIVTEGGRFYTEPIAIFSDRCAVEFEAQYPQTTQFLVTHANGHARGYRWLRLVINPADHRDADEAFVRLGRMVAGHYVRLDLPDYEWAWTQGLIDGADIEEQPGGASFASLRHPPRRVWSVSRNVLHSPREANAVLHSPDDADVDTLRSWVEFAELARRMGGSYEDAALVWEADRFMGGVLPGNKVRVSAHYHELALVRALSHGEAQHSTWEGQTMNLFEGDLCVPRPRALIRGIQFAEQL